MSEAEGKVSKRFVEGIRELHLENGFEVNGGAQVIYSIYFGGRIKRKERQTQRPSKREVI